VDEKPEVGEDTQAETPRRGSDVPPNPSDEFEAALAEFDELESHIGVWRLASNGEQEYLGRLPVTGFSLEEVSSRWGGGKYQLRVRERNVWRKATRVRIAGRPKEPEDAPAVSEEPKGSGIEDAIRDIRSLLMEMRNPPPQAETANPIMMATELIKSTQSMMEPYLRRLSEREPSDADKMVEMVRLGVDLAEGRRKEEGYGEVIREVGVPLVKMLGDRVAKTPSDPGNQAPQSRQPSNFSEAVGAWLPTIVEWARAGKDPELRADFVMDELPDVWAEPLAEWAASGVATTTILSQVPELGAHRDWVTLFFARLSEFADRGDNGGGEEDGATASSPGNDYPTAPQGV